MAHSQTTDVELREKGWLLCAEAARKVNRSPQTIYRWIDNGDVKGYPDGYRRYVHWESLLEYIGKPACKVHGFNKKDIWTETAG